MTTPTEIAAERLSAVRETLVYFNSLMDRTGERFMFDVSKDIDAVDAILAALTPTAVAGEGEEDQGSRAVPCQGHPAEQGSADVPESDAELFRVAREFLSSQSLQTLHSPLAGNQHVLDRQMVVFLLTLAEKNSRKRAAKPTEAGGPKGGRRENQENPPLPQAGRAPSREEVADAIRNVVDAQSGFTLHDLVREGIYCMRCGPGVKDAINLVDQAADAVLALTPGQSGGEPAPG